MLISGIQLAIFSDLAIWLEKPTAICSRLSDAVAKRLVSSSLEPEKISRSQEVAYRACLGDPSIFERLVGQE
jgi:hypothetical protein